MKLDTLASEIVGELRGIAGRNRYAYDDGSAHISKEHQKQVEKLVHDGLTLKEFETALKDANHRFAADLVEGKIDPATLPYGERELARALEAVRATNNPSLIDSAKEFARLQLNNEIEFVNYRSRGAYGESLLETRIVVATRCSWNGKLDAVSDAITGALAGRFDRSPNGLPIASLDHWANEPNAYDDHTRGLKMSARALRGDIKEHLSDNAAKLAADLPANGVARTFHMNG